MDPTKEAAADGVIVSSSLLPLSVTGLYLTWVIDIRCGRVSSFDH